MPRQQQDSEAQSQKKARQPYRATSLLSSPEQQTDRVAPLLDPSLDPIVSPGSPDLTAWLANAQVQHEQHVQLAGQIGRVQGNQHMQRVIASLRSDEPKVNGVPISDEQSHTKSVFSLGQQVEIDSGLVPTAFVQRFGPTGHWRAEEAATGSTETLGIDLGDGTQLTAREINAFGDYFGNPSEILALAETEPGRAELRWARWWALRFGSEPSVSDNIKERVRNRYYRLTAQNIAHFAAGEAARNEYERYHEEALRFAFCAGAIGQPTIQRARISEAFSHHFLSDMFSAGHIRTPREQIKHEYVQLYPNSLNQFITYMARWMTRALDDRGDIPWYWPNSTVEGRLAQRIMTLAGPAAESFSLGDVISGAFHDADGVGLGVISDVGPNGQEVPGGYRWCAGGDDLPATATITLEMTAAALRTSQTDLDFAFELGLRESNGMYIPETTLYEAEDAAINSLKPFAAERFIPREDPDAGNQVRSWRWGEIDSAFRAEIDTFIRNQIAPELRNKAGGVPEVIRFTRGGDEDPNGAVSLHVRAALIAFCDYLAGTGTAALEQAIGQPALVPEPEPLRDAGVELPAGVPDGGI